METRISTHACFAGQFEFVLHIQKGVGEKECICKAEILERGTFVTELEFVEIATRLEIAEFALTGCIAWAEERLQLFP